MVLLTKSKYMNGLKCDKLLWIIFNANHLIPDVTESAQFRFDVGNEVGEFAKKVFQNGIDLPTDFKINLQKTSESLSERKPLFEAGFMKENLFSRIDILNPVNKDEWDIIEVKSTTSVKEEFIDDISFQKHTVTISGLKIRKCFLMHINNKYVKKGDINPKELFTIVDLTEKVELKLKGIEKRIENMFKIISQPNIPIVQIGEHCRTPYECPMIDECWGFLPDNSIFNLYNARKKKLFQLVEDGNHSILDIPNDYKLTEKQKIQINCEKDEKNHINKNKIKEFVDALEYPLYYLDFETINPAIPLHDGMRPYQRIPFQFSLHVVEKSGRQRHHEFLHDSKNDPRKTFLEKLKKYLGEKGNIIVYNQSFEIGVLKELAEAFPNYKEWNDLITSRVVDLLKPFSEFYYYNPRQKGSASIKKVLPALTNKSYAELEIGDGNTANIAYYNSIYGNLNQNEIEKIRKNLLIYCGQDTESMIWILDELIKIAYA